ncbi:MAG TPA: hypothetical protein VFK30_05895, partial [Anaerolineae bacterium]|nr:hypothetical protein [Anaerolineae bacterium]
EWACAFTANRIVRLPLWVSRRHSGHHWRCPLDLQRRTFGSAMGTSASESKGEIRHSLDHLVCASEHRERHGDTKRSGRLEVDHHGLVVGNLGDYMRMLGIKADMIVFPLVATIKRKKFA